jgi:hypothetical protein
MVEVGEMTIHEVTPVVRMQTDGLPLISVETRLKGSDHTGL